MSITKETPDLSRPNLLEELTSNQIGSGIEVERVSADGESIKEPFDPEKIDVKTKNISVDLLMARIRGGDREIDLLPDFQRRAGIWDTRRKSRLIESLMLRIPLPVFYVAADEHERWSVVDGLQRITTLKEFILDKMLTLEGLEFLSNQNGNGFDDLSRQMQRRINETEITVHIIQPGTPSAVMFNIFKRINTGGLPLSAQEIRHAIKQGTSTRLLKDLAESKYFRDATRNSIKDERMADRECVLRFFAFFIHSPDNSYSGDLDTFLINTMDEINSLNAAQINKLEAKFNFAMSSAERVLGKFAFRKYYGPNYRLSPINKALFEAWSVNLANLDANRIEALIHKRNSVMESFSKLVNTSVFNDSISVGTNSVFNVNYRFSAIKNLIEEVLNA